MIKRLEILEKVHKIKEKRLTSPKMEDYLEVIYELLKEKGYVKSKDISRILNVKASTVTIMLKALAEKKLINYEKYGGITLTEEGIKKAEEISRKHKIIIDFLLLLGIDEKQANLEAEGIEHIISDETLRKIEKLYNLIKEDEVIERKIKEKLYNV
ncbi:MAG: metal-dependent transcriptional regulator [Thermoproteota archaeon]|nr:metal-dependent transcriptional regulator [Thermoproteota archaeon]